MKQPCKANSKRGSMLVTALFLLLFILIMGMTLVMWGMSNVQTSVNSREVTQAYYSAKSLCDLVVQELANKTEAAMQFDEQIQSLPAIGEAVTGEMLTATYDSDPNVMTPDTLTIGDLPADKATLTIKCVKDLTGVRENGKMKNGIQKIAVSATCTYRKFTRTVTRTMEVEHRPPTSGISGFNCGLNGLASPSAWIDLYYFNIWGKTTIAHNAALSITGCEIRGDVQIDSNTVDIAGTNKFTADKGDTVKTVDIYAASTSLKGRILFDSAVTIYGKVNNNASPPQPNYTVKPGKAPPKFDSYTLIAPEPPKTKVDNLSKYNNKTLSESVRAKDMSDLSNATIETGGKNIVIIAPSISLRGTITCKGGGSVTFYAETGDLTLNSMTLSRDAATRVSFVSIENGIGVMDGAGKSYNANFLCPKGTFSFSGVMQGTIWCNAIMRSDIGISPYRIDTRNPTKPEDKNWWGNTDGLTQKADAGGGGASGIIKYTISTYE